MIGTFAFIQVENPEPADELVVDGRGHCDLVSASSAAMRMTLRGGAASDVLPGGPGDDVLEGGDDFDGVDGGGGDDIADLGDYFDRFTWNPGDGNDVVDGGASHDSISFNGADLPELVTLAADGRRLRITRDVDSSVTDLGGIEEVNLLTGAGNDSVDSSGLPPGIVDLVVD